MPDARLAALALALASTLPAAAHATADEAARPALAVRIVGDSHVARLGPRIERAVRDEGAVSLGYLSRRGWSTGRYVRANDLVDRMTENGRPDVVVVSLGGNDRCASRAVYAAQLARVVAAAREAGATRVVWLGPAASDGERSEYARHVADWHERNADWQRELLPAMGVEWIDSRPLTRGGHGADGIHFTPSGYDAWSARALARVRLRDAAS
ncbi:MAG: SGNH/GDSL hydrolase family protein [Sandaracinaceae bacterium]|nr:SGNH/GDSL hydrolase family protein [Sandaracinaceae bacterium]